MERLLPCYIIRNKNLKSSKCVPSTSGGRPPSTPSWPHFPSRNLFGSQRPPAPPGHMEPSPWASLGLALLPVAGHSFTCVHVAFDCESLSLDCQIHGGRDLFCFRSARPWDLSQLHKMCSTDAQRMKEQMRSRKAHSMSIALGITEHIQGWGDPKTALYSEVLGNTLLNEKTTSKTHIWVFLGWVFNTWMFQHTETTAFVF